MVGKEVDEKYLAEIEVSRVLMCNLLYIHSVMLQCIVMMMMMMTLSYFDSDAFIVFRRARRGSLQMKGDEST